MIKGIKYWIALEQTGGIGPVNLREIHKTLLSMNLSIEDLFGCSKEEIIREFHFSEKLSSLIESAKNTAARIDNDCLVLADAKISVIPFFAPEYPSKLLNIMGNSFPPILYVIGDASILGKKGIALLGGGEISAVGETILFASARELARHNIIIISGMAKGADLIAHRAAMVSGGKTAAFIPGGMFHFKIPEFILDAMTPDNLVVVSPFFPSKEMNKFNAFTRNRIICALSYAVFIVEATADEGIFDAAKSAQKLGVPLYTTEYSKYPESAKGNPLILESLGGSPIRRRSGMAEPNVDQLIAHAKFG